MNATRPGLKFGDKGSDVVVLQKRLNSELWLNPRLRTEGNFDKDTDAAVRAYQAGVGIGIDGVVEDRTWTALHMRIRCQVRDIQIGSCREEAPWMAYALKECKQREYARGNNPQIVAYHATTTLKATRDEVAWCSSFVNWCLKQAGISGTNSAAAISWLSWGHGVGPRKGAITVLYNFAAPHTLTASGNHVGFLLYENGTEYVLLGGNQGKRGEVIMSHYPKRRWSLKGYRWPR